MGSPEEGVFHVLGGRKVGKGKGNAQFSQPSPGEETGRHE